MGLHDRVIGRSGEQRTRGPQSVFLLVRPPDQPISGSVHIDCSPDHPISRSPDFQIPRSHIPGSLAGKEVMW